MFGSASCPTALISVTLVPHRPRLPPPPPAAGSYDDGEVVLMPEPPELPPEPPELPPEPPRETIHVVLPRRPSECTVGALCEKLFGVWDARAVRSAATTLSRMTETERRLARYRQEAAKAGGLVRFDGFGHPAVVGAFLPSHALVVRARRVGDEAGDEELCRASEAFDRGRPAHAVLLCDGQTLALHEVDPDAALDTSYRRIDQLVLAARAKASALSPGGGARKMKNSKKKKNNNNNNSNSKKAKKMAAAASTSSGRSTKKEKNRAAAASAVSVAAASGGAPDSDAELDYGYGTALLMSVRTAYYFVLARWVVGDGEALRLGPVSARHTVADLAVLVQRKLGLVVSKQRMTFRGRLLELGERLGRLGLVNEHVTDPVLLSEVGEGTFEVVEDGAGMRADRKSVGEKVVF
jgi:hypothetical protein